MFKSPLILTHFILQATFAFFQTLDTRALELQKQVNDSRYRP